MKTYSKHNKILADVKVSLELGFAVFPVEQGGKKPMISGWPKRATKDWIFARRYFGNHLNLNYGIVTGGASGIFVLDVDGDEGKINLAILETFHGKLPRTLKVETPHGEHYYFRPGNAVVPNSVGKITAHSDVRGEGGYVVGPGSSTREGAYAFAPGCGPEDVPIAAALARRPGRKEELRGEPGACAYAEDSASVARVFAGGPRLASRGNWSAWRRRCSISNNTLNLCVFRAGQLAARGLVDRAKATSELATIAKSIGLGEAEIERTIESAFRAGLDSPAQIPFVDGSSAQTSNAPASVSDADLTKELATLGETDTDNAERFVKRCGAKVIFSPSSGVGWRTTARASRRVRNWPVSSWPRRWRGKSPTRPDICPTQRRLRPVSAFHNTRSRKRESTEW